MRHDSSSEPRPQPSRNHLLLKNDFRPLLLPQKALSPSADAASHTRELVMLGPVSHCTFGRRMHEGVASRCLGVQDLDNGRRQHLSKRESVEFLGRSQNWGSAH
jgi:hypothetical protein